MREAMDFFHVLLLCVIAFAAEMVTEETVGYFGR